MGILDYFTPEARRGNRQALEGLLMQFIPPEMRPQLNLLAELNPVVSMERAGQDAQQLFAPDQTLMDRLAAGGRMASNMAGVVAPAMVAGRAGVPVANAVQDVLTGYAPMVQPFMADEFGGVGFKAYHGSPHSFDKFSMDKIGTGEGAQAYGHGLYFAGNEGVAKGYRDMLSSPDGFKVLAAASDAHIPHGSKLREISAAVGEGVGQTPEQFKASILDKLRNPPAGTGVYELEDLSMIADDLEAGKWDVQPKNPGSMYEVNINADPEAFLDWDKPLSEQKRAVDALRPIIGNVRNPGYGVKRAIDDASKYLGYADDPRRAEDLLREAGIPGIRYLDAGSRGAADVKELRGTVSMWTNAVNKTPNDDYAWKMLEDAESALKQAEAGLSRNYVIFDENLISIVRKYGIAGAAAMLGMSQADVAQAMGQQPQGLLESGPQ